MMKPIALSILTTIATLLVAAPIALAHPGPRIWLDVVAGRVGTYSGPYPPSGNPADYIASRVFSQDMGTSFDDDDVSWQTEFPGFQLRPGSTVASGTQFYYDIVTELYWFDNVRGYFVPISLAFPTNTPQMYVSTSAGETQITSNGFVSGDLFFRFDGSSSYHQHMTFTLAYDGVNIGDDVPGVFALGLDVRAAGAVTSEPFWVVLGDQAAPANLESATELLTAVTHGFIPESRWGGGFVLLAPVLTRRRGK